MRLTFESCPLPTARQRQRQFAQLLDRQVRYCGIETLARAQPGEGSSIHFLVIDVTPRPSEPVKIREALHRLLTSPTSALERDIIEREVRTGGCVRLLFVGATPTIDAWEDESGERISAKKSLEFYIRALQKGGLAHYGSVVAAGEYCSVNAKGPFDPGSRGAGLARSAAIGLARHYAQYPPSSFADRAATLRRANAELLSHAGKTEPHLLGGPADSEEERSALMREIAALFQLGKRDPVRAYEGAATAIRGSYRIRNQLDGALRDWAAAGDGTTEAADAAIPVASNVSGLVRYEILRDLGRCIAMGAVQFLRKAREHWAGGVLIVDDELAELISNEGGSGDQRLLTRLRGLVALIGWDSDCVVMGSEDFRIDRESPDHLAADLRLTEAKLRVRKLTDGTVELRPLRDFGLIFTEVESRRAYVGPNLVQRLATLAGQDPGEPALAEPAGSEPGPATSSPPIIVLTRTESIGHIQQSLNLGGEGYVLKERLFQLPMQMRRALDGRASHRNQTSLTSSFKKLKALRPEVRSELLRTDGLSFVHGGFWHGQELVIDDREADWLRLLPKADLHCHFGTSISYAAVRAVALNSVAYLLPRDRWKFENESFRSLVRTVVAAVLLAEWIQQVSGLDPMAALALGAGALVDGDLPERLPKFALGDGIVDWLHQPCERVQTFEVATLLVAAICTDRAAGRYPAAAATGLDACAPPDVFAHIARGGDSGTDPAFSEAVATATVLLDQELGGIVRAWGRDDTKPLVAAAFPESQTDGAAHWERRADLFRRRLKNSDRRLRHERAGAWQWLCGRREPIAEELARLAKRWSLCEPPGRARPGSLEARLKRGPSGPMPTCVPLERYVQVRDDPYELGRQERGLQRYLRGADLLGSAHLQYPENLLVAAFAIALDRAEENITYAEIRCETTGYCQGGMNAYGATDLLCRAFDLATLLIAGRCEGRYPLARTGLLLAAKRHKKKEAASQVVMLMQHYLRRRGERTSPYPLSLPIWWAPCQVLGFDISGDESKDPPWLEKILDPLAILSSPITIHAGEAATADSIWRAVYRHNATRIGHGLRLREESRLLAYCVNEGICMEMCPNSNVFTNGFQIVRGRYPQAGENPRSAYPLWEYMTKGLEVALATDNRYLHQQGQQTLTSEYLAAARLSNGLTRWEILQLVKAGFKNAFLPKKDVHALLSAMEDRVYRIISRGWF